STPVLSESSPYEFVSGTELFYSSAGSNSGSFTADVTASAASGIARVAFPTVTGFTGGGDDTASPYSQAYSWSSGASASGNQTVTAFSRAGGSSSTTFMLTPDANAPTGQTIAVTGGPWFTTRSISVTSTDGSDTGAGLDTTTRLLERRQATLSNGTCSPAWSSWTTVTSPDTTVLGGFCYQYGFSIADRVANRSARATTGTQMV